MIRSNGRRMLPLGGVLTLMLTAGALAGGQAATAAVHGARATSPSAAAASGWVIQRTPTPNVPTASLDALSCPTAAWCMSVGSYTGSQGVQQPLAEIWTGTAWHAVPAASAGGALGTSLHGVSCSSPKACVAVGYSLHFGRIHRFEFGVRAFAERWNGSAWRAIAPPRLGIPVNQSTRLTSVSCASATSCTAVGSFGDLNTDPQQPFGAGLLETWNGTRWSRVFVPAPQHIAVALTSVSCTRLNACVAAGAYLAKGKPNLPFAVSRPRASAAWRFATMPAPFPTTPSALRAGKDFDLVASSVACPRANACTLVGNYRHEATGATDFPVFTEAWNGTRWRLLPVPKLQRQSELDSVSCWAPASCQAIGSTGFADTQAPLTLRRSGPGWTRAAPPLTLPVPADRMLSCRSATSCIMVGSNVGGQNQSGRLQGTTWTALAVPSPAGTVSDSLADVSCPPAGACKAVGSFSPGAPGDRVLIESGGPGAWSISSAPRPSGVFQSELESVSCPAAMSCVALGDTLATRFGRFRKPFSEAWNGSAWQIVATADPGTNFGATLADVSCTSATFCVAVGDAVQNTGTTSAPSLTSRQLIEQWNGSAWKIVAAAGPAGATNSDLETVSCASASFCAALGTATVTGKEQPLAEKFDGHAWTTLSHAGLPASGTRLSCTSPTFCMAAGETAGGRPLTREWTGSAWKAVAAPAPSPLGGEGAGLNDVSCSSRTACTAIGSNVFDVAEAEGFDFDDHPFAETWNGATWKPAGLPVPAGTMGNILASISCAGPARCWTAGVTLRIAAQQVPLIERGG